MKTHTFFILLILSSFQSLVYCQNDSLKGGELYSSNFLIDGIQRNFTYYMPVNYGKKDLYPLTIILHDTGKSSKDVIKSYGHKIQTLADSSDCIVVYPDAVGSHWNDKMSEGFPASDTTNDVGFMSILIDYFRDVYYCDAKRVYVAGLGNGGKLAYRLSCDIAFKITAIAAYASYLEDASSKCKSDTSVAKINFDEPGGGNPIADAWNFFMSHGKN